MGLTCSTTSQCERRSILRLFFAINLEKAVEAVASEPRALNLQLACVVGFF